MKNKRLGLYVHIPFCVRKCNYCDFCSFQVVSVEKRQRYVDALIKEIQGYKSKGLALDTVFFGGGTPSLLEACEFETIVNAIVDTFALKDGYEFTVELNPGTVSRQKLETYKKVGVNRISIGLQSIHENEQKILGRIHSYDDFENTFSLCRLLGFNNINVDLMYAIPTQTKESFDLSIDRVLSLGPEHISAYSLILEEGTPLFERRDSLPLVDEETERAMYDSLCATLKKNGYSHYEISNYARAGFESKHNLIYWQMQDYIGVGLASHSYFEGVRFFNTDSIDEYIGGSVPIIDGGRTSDEEKYEYAMLALRTKFGFSCEEYQKRFSEDFIKKNKEKIDEYLKRGLLTLDKDRISLTESGFYVSNFILADLL